MLKLWHFYRDTVKPPLELSAPVLSGEVMLQRHMKAHGKKVTLCANRNRSVMIRTCCGAHLGDERWAWPAWVFNGWYHILCPTV